MYLNKALVIGNLTRDPEVKALPSGIQVSTFSVATNRVWKDKNGAKQESVDFHNVVVFGRQAETVGQYLKKGSSVLVEGRMQTRSWDGQDGVKKYRTEIVADRVQFGPRSAGSAGAGAGAGATGGASSAGASGAKGGEDAPIAKEALDTIEYPSEEINPDDIPF
ncbi:single-stranded DNA-binding protein [Candidatus Parcubacteria bacterium]|nr:single-stranded DNA-binding protein [Candidatus Parcubacteria bacterium]